VDDNTLFATPNCEGKHFSVKVIADIKFTASQIVLVMCMCQNNKWMLFFALCAQQTPTTLHLIQNLHSNSNMIELSLVNASESALSNQRAEVISGCYKLRSVVLTTTICRNITGGE